MQVLCSKAIKNMELWNAWLSMSDFFINNDHWATYYILYGKLPNGGCGNAQLEENLIYQNDISLYYCFLEDQGLCKTQFSATLPYHFVQLLAH